LFRRPSSSRSATSASALHLALAASNSCSVLVRDECTGWW
jgi:hypothetical protein